MYEVAQGMSKTIYYDASTAHLASGINKYFGFIGWAINIRIISMSHRQDQSTTFKFHSTMMVGWGGGILRRGMVDRLRSMVGHLIKVSLALICDIRHIAIVVVGMVGDMLGPAIRQGDRVGALNVACTVGRLPGVEVCPGVVVVHSILKTVRLGLVRVDRCRSVVGRGRGVVSRDRGVVGRGRGVVNRCRGMVRGVPGLSKDCRQESSNCDESLRE